MWQFYSSRVYQTGTTSGTGRTGVHDEWVLKISYCQQVNACSFGSGLLSTMWSVDMIGYLSLSWYKFHGRLYGTSIPSQCSAAFSFKCHAQYPSTTISWYWYKVWSYNMEGQMGEDWACKSQLALLIGDITWVCRWRLFLLVLFWKYRKTIILWRSLCVFYW